MSAALFRSVALRDHTDVEEVASSQDDEVCNFTCSEAAGDSTETMLDKPRIFTLTSEAPLPDSPFEVRRLPCSHKGQNQHAFEIKHTTNETGALCFACCAGAAKLAQDR